MGMPMLSISLRKRSRFSVMSIASVSTPIMRTPVLLPDAELLTFDGEVQRGLSAHGGQHRIDLVLLQDLLDARGGQRQQVDVVRRDRIGHDGGRVAVDQRDLDAFFAK